jgi:hypothetical protein|tara:strand:- start:453 stop:767 length:315 start_codon:yes stop_codon:yes gene_type:complete
MIYINEEYQITADEYQFIVQRVYRGALDPKTGKDRVNNKAYFPTIGGCMTWFFDRKVFEATRTLSSIKEIHAQACATAALLDNILSEARESIGIEREITPADLA